MLPVGAYVSWNGQRFEGNGVAPDVPVDWIPGEPDNQLQRAIETVRAM
jgi:C-terminal processing protease CtpA/Prc